jgi:hypothetical protein
MTAGWMDFCAFCPRQLLARGSMKEHAAYRQEIIMPLAQFLLSHIGRRHDIRMTGLYGNTDL